MQEVSLCLNGIRNKQSYTFISFDIINFYPSITQEVLLDALKYATTHFVTTPEEIDTIMHARKSLLFNTDQPWVKISQNKLFDVSMGSYDAAEICELVVAYILNLLSTEELQNNVGLYRDDGLAILRDQLRQVENTKVAICKISKSVGLGITIEAKRKIIKFLDVTLNLIDATHKPFNKPGNTPIYIHHNSQQPSSIYH